MRIEVYIKTNVEFGGEDGKTAIINALCGYVNSLGLGASVPANRLYEFVYAVPGVSEVRLIEVYDDETGNLPVLERWSVPVLLGEKVHVVVEG